MIKLINHNRKDIIERASDTNFNINVYGISDWIKKNHTYYKNLNHFSIKEDEIKKTKDLLLEVNSKKIMAIKKNMPTYPFIHPDEELSTDIAYSVIYLKHHLNYWNKSIWWILNLPNPQVVTISKKYNKILYSTLSSPPRSLAKWLLFRRLDNVEYGTLKHIAIINRKILNKKTKIESGHNV